MFCRLDTRNKTLPSICIIKQFWEIVPCLPYSNNLFFFLLFYVLKIILENSSTFWMRTQLNRMRSIHADYCNRNHFHNEQIFIGLTSCTMIYFLKNPLQTKCFRIVPSERYHVKEVFQTKYSSWIGNLKAKKRNSYKRLIPFALTLNTFCFSIHEFLQTNLWMGAFLTNTIDWWTYFSNEHHFVFDDSQ